MSKPTQDEYDRLVAAVEHARQLQYEKPDVAKAHGALQEIFIAHEPFRPKKPLVSSDWWDGNGIRHTNERAIQETDEVKLRLSETAGVKRSDVVKALAFPTGDGFYVKDRKVDTIMALLAKGKVDYE